MKKIIFWHRRDLRIEDNHGLFQAAKHNCSIFPIFIFDTNILNSLDKNDQRVSFIWDSLLVLQKKYSEKNIHLNIFFGDPTSLIPKICFDNDIKAVFTNRDYESYPIQRDKKIKEQLAIKQIKFFDFHDHTIFAPDQIYSNNGFPYKVFTPYKQKWLEQYLRNPIIPFGSSQLLNENNNPLTTSTPNINKIEDIGFLYKPYSHFGFYPGITGAQMQLANFLKLINNYDDRRNYPATQETSLLGPHLRFGTIGIRTLAQIAFKLQNKGADTWLSELIWRDFYTQLLGNFPRINNLQNFKTEYDNHSWPYNDYYYQMFIKGTTGYPIVDAGIHQLLQTGYMHNRVRMITASFFTKHLLLDWRLGADFFAKYLMDFDFSANNGGWQWAASTGSDAQPYFRIFNPITQSEKFDPDALYIKTWLPIFQRIPPSFCHNPQMLSNEEQQKFGFTLGLDYPYPIVEHHQAREKALNFLKTN